ncbi:MAG: hypothetical protein IKU48_06000 [Clostridia bacterium]|nr:hypothetical protein [Clostridia bacterium]
MPRFNKSQINELKNYLYTSNIHDGVIKNVLYERAKKTLTIKISTHINNQEINVHFLDVHTVLFISGKESGNSDTILSLSIEDNYSNLQTNSSMFDKNIINSLYMMFQMFSGDELHIASQEVFFESAK